MTLTENNYISKNVLEEFVSELKNSHLVWNALRLKITRSFLLQDDGMIKGVAIVYPGSDNKLAVCVSMDKNTLDKKTLKLGLRKIYELQKDFGLQFDFDSDSRIGWQRFISMKLGIR